MMDVAIRTVSGKVIAVPLGQKKRTKSGERKRQRVFQECTRRIRRERERDLQSGPGWMRRA